ncbi:probable carboxylesterase 15 [Fagus crenata]
MESNFGEFKATFSGFQGTLSGFQSAFSGLQAMMEERLPKPAEPNVNQASSSIRVQPSFVADQIDPKVAECDPKVATQIVPKVAAQIDPKVAKCDPKVAAQIVPKVAVQIDPKVAECDPKDKTAYMVGIFNIALPGSIFAVTLLAIHDRSMQLTVIGFLCVGISIGMYASPLLSMEALQSTPLVNPFGPSSPNLAEVTIDPILVVVGSDEILKDRVEDYARSLKELGKKIEYVEFEGKQHDFFTDHPLSEVAKRVIQLIKGFMTENSD